MVKKFLERGQDVLPWINFFTSNALFVSSVVSSFCWIKSFHLPVNQLFLACQPSLVVCSYAAMVYCYVIASLISQVITYLVINVVTGLYGITFNGLYHTLLLLFFCCMVSIASICLVYVSVS